MRKLLWAFVVVILVGIVVLYGIKIKANQSVVGHGNNAVQGNNNQVTNSTNVKDCSKVENYLKDYNSHTAVEDLKNHDFKTAVITYEKSPRTNKQTLLIVTATNFETGILHQVAKDKGYEINKEMIRDHVVYKLNNKSNKKLEILHMQPGMMGMLEPSSTPLMIMSVYNDLKPNYIIATGIAFGRQAKGHKLGDILTSKQLVNYETRKEINGNIYFRGDKVTSNMLEQVNAGIHNWKGAKVHQGLVLSGNVLVNSQPFLDMLAKKEPEFEGGEMESYGVYAVASMVGAKWVMIKGISDWGDGTKNDNYHRQALENAMQFIFHIVPNLN